MSKSKTKVLREAVDVDARLQNDLELDRDLLLDAVDVARSEGANATPYHCANAAGTFAYQHGTFALRKNFVGEVWSVDRSNGVEAILNQRLKIRVVFANVDVACNDAHLPRPRSPKGAGAERVCQGNLFLELPHFVQPLPDENATYYLMVDEKGASELSRPVVQAGTFGAYAERLYLSDGRDPIAEKLPLDEADAVAGFDPQVIRIPGAN